MIEILDSVCRIMITYLGHSHPLTRHSAMRGVGEVKQFKIGGWHFEVEIGGQDKSVTNRGTGLICY